MQEFLNMVFCIEEQKKEDFINALAREPDPNDPVVQNAIANRLGINFGLWSQWERERIANEVAKRWRC